MQINKKKNHKQQVGTTTTIEIYLVYLFKSNTYFFSYKEFCHEQIKW